MEGLSLLDKITLAFNPDQERDEDGKWTSSGSEPKTGKVDPSEIKLGADLSGRDLRDMNLTGMDLTGVNLNGANLLGAQVIGADLSGTNLLGANLSLTNLTGAHFTGADLTGAMMLNATLTDTDLTGANLTKVDFQYSELKNVDFTDANLTNANFQYSELKNVDFTDAIVTGADFTDVNLNKVTMSSEQRLEIKQEIEDLKTADGRAVKEVVSAIKEELGKKDANMKYEEYTDDDYEAKIYTKDDKLMGNMSFSVNDGTLSIGIVQISDQYQGEGTATVIQQAIINEALDPQNGIDFVAFHANIAHGGYAWADTSYPTQGSWGTVQGFVGEQIKEMKETDEGKKIDFSNVEKALESDDPRSIQIIHDDKTLLPDSLVSKSTKGNELGRELLLDSDWYAIMPTSPENLANAQRRLAASGATDRSSWMPDVPEKDLSKWLPWPCYVREDGSVTDDGIWEDFSDAKRTKDFSYWPVTLAFNPDQERDAGGKWTSGGAEPKTGKVDSSEIKPDADLSHRDLSGMDLLGADLRDANLREANLSDANLREANLSGADLTNADLREANLMAAELRDARLQGTYLRGADLSGADLSSARLTNAYLFNANLSGASLFSAYLDDANLTGANLNSAMLTDADLRDADLTRANLNGAYLNTATLREADLSNADLSNADLTNADLSGANLSGADLRGANLTDANLRGADLTDADLSRANTTGADMGGALLRGATIPQLELSNKENNERLEVAKESAQFPPNPTLGSFSTHELSFDELMEAINYENKLIEIRGQTYLQGAGKFTEGADPEALKKSVEDQIRESADFGAFSGIDKDSLRTPRSYTDAWQHSSNSTSEAEMIQESASRVLLNQEADLPEGWYNNYEGTSAQAELVVFEMYQRTQKELADVGYKPDDTVTLFRGIRDADDLSLRPLSSWSLQPSVAQRFSGDSGLVFVADVQVANIVSLPTTGFGCYDESEVIILSKGADNLTAAYNPDQERDENGRWTSSGETTDKEAEKIVNAVLQNEGYSVKPLTGEVPMSGYMVAVPNTSHVVSSEDFFNKQNTDKVADSLDDFMEKHEAAFDDGAWLGLWYSKETSEIVYDVVDQIENREEAVAQGVARDQISIYDVVNGVEIQTGGTGGLTASGQARSFHNPTRQEMVGNDLGRKTNMDSFGSRAFRGGSKQTLAFNPDQPRDADGKWASGSTSEPKTGKVDPSEIVPNADLSGRDLLGMDLSGRDLSGINFTGARLYHANLSGANLSGADLNDANLGGADLTAADLTNADLTNAKLTHANLHEADLINTNLTNADLTGAIVIKADLNSADLSGAIGISPSIKEANSENESLLAEAKATINTDEIKNFDARIIYEESPVSSDDAVTPPPKEGSPEWRLWENPLDRSPIDLKVEVEDQVAASAVFSTSVTNESLLAPRDYADTWADNSNDNRESEAIQESASRVLLNQEAPLPEGWEDHYKGQSDQVELVMLKMYERTQKYLSDQGYKEDDTLTLYRGVQMEFGDRPPSWEVDTPLQLRPLSSWSTEFEVAKVFLRDNGYILEAEVPITNIVSLPMTGLGCLGEREVVVGRPNSQSMLDNLTAAFDPNQERDENGRWTSGGGTDTETFLGRDGSEKIANIADPDMARYARTNADLIRENTPKSGYEGADPLAPSDEVFKRNDVGLQQIASRAWAATFQQCEDITIAADNLLGFATQDREWSEDVQFGRGEIDTNAAVYAQEMLDALTEDSPNNESYESALFNIKENWNDYGLENILVGENTDVPYAMRGINNNTGFMDSLDLAFQEKENVGWSLASFVPAGDFAARMRNEVSGGENEDMYAISIAKGFQSTIQEKMSGIEPERVGLIHLTNGSALAVSTDSYEIVTGGEFKIVDRLTGPQATDYLENLTPSAEYYEDGIDYQDQTVYVVEQVALPDYERGD